MTSGSRAEHSLCPMLQFTEPLGTISTRLCWNWSQSFISFPHDCVDVSVTRNVLSWSGGHESEPWSGRTWGAWYFCPKQYLNQKIKPVYWQPFSNNIYLNSEVLQQHCYDNRVLLPVSLMQYGTQLWRQKLVYMFPADKLSVLSTQSDAPYS